jgi:hypothetical protein
VLPVVTERILQQLEDDEGLAGKRRIFSADGTGLARSFAAARRSAVSLRSASSRIASGEPG